MGVRGAGVENRPGNKRERLARPLAPPKILRFNSQPGAGITVQRPGISNGRLKGMTMRKRFLFLSGAALCCTAAALAEAPTTLFQIDGKAPNSSLSCSYGPCDYWNLLNGNGIGANPGSQGHSLVRTFLNGTATTDSFTGGGSKDPSDLSQWAYSTSPTPNKDAINAGYAAAYIAPSGDFELMFGANRASPNGDANVGIWFFQQQVGLGPNGKFTGVHVDHDIFVISAFTGGGGTSGIAVFEWDHNCASGVKNPIAGQCSDSNLRLLGSLAAGTACGTSNFCAVTNAATTTSTWTGDLVSPLFFQGGVDITAVLSAAAPGTTLPCFSSFLEETRSSQSTTSVLKDFVLGGFPVCGLSISKACAAPTVASGGTSINYPVGGVVTNTGIGTLFNVSVFDTVGATTKAAILVNNTTSGSNFFHTSTLAAGDSGSWTDTTTASVSSLNDSAIAKAAITSGGALTVTTATPATATCTFTANTTLSITKACTTSLVAEGGIVDVLVSFSGQVCNNGPGQVTGIVLTDTPSSGTAATINVGTLAPCSTFSGATCTVPACSNYAGTYKPTGIDSGNGTTATPGRYFWSDSIAITGATSALAGDTLNKVPAGQPFAGTYGGAGASCPICPAGACPVQ
jgi:hypothetical protein